jgi:SOS-response transcriptional repressor LexA
MPPSRWRHARTAESDGRREFALQKTPPPKQGQYLAFIHLYTRLHRRPPAETDMQQYFRVSPPSVHQMVLTLERAGFIRRQPRVPRSIEVLVDPEHLPELL